MNHTATQPEAHDVQESDTLFMVAETGVLGRPWYHRVEYNDAAEVDAYGQADGWMATLHMDGERPGDTDVITVDHRRIMDAIARVMDDPRPEGVPDSTRNAITRHIAGKQFLGPQAADHLLQVVAHGRVTF